jgi:integrase
MLSRRCGCRDESGRQYGALVERPTAAQRAKACPKMSDAKHGKWGYALSTVDPINGKRVQVRESGLLSRQAAQRAANLKRVALDTGTHVTGGSETVSEFLARWLPRHVQTGRSGAGLKPSSAGLYRRVVADISETRFGSMKLRDVKRRDVQALLNDQLDAGKGVASVHKWKTVLQASLGAAEDEESVSPGVTSRLRLPRENPAVPKPWDDDNLARFLALAETYRLGALFDFAIETGLRRGELLGLRWSDIDSVARVLHVRHNRVQTTDGVFEGTPKTASSQRAISLSDRSVGILMAWRVRQLEEKTLWDDAWNDGDYVFTLEDGSPVEPNACTRAFARLVARANVGPMVLHGLRHQHASMWIALGFSEAILSQRLGHSTGTITRRYTHAMGDADRAGAEAVSAQIAAAVSVHSTVHSTPEN